jgi:hypothetical protein
MIHQTIPWQGSAGPPIDSDARVGRERCPITPSWNRCCDESRPETTPTCHVLFSMAQSILHSARAYCPMSLGQFFHGFGGGAKLYPKTQGGLIRPCATSLSPSAVKSHVCKEYVPDCAVIETTSTLTVAVMQGHEVVIIVNLLARFQPSDPRKLIRTVLKRFIVGCTCHPSSRKTFFLTGFVSTGVQMSGGFQICHTS